MGFIRLGKLLALLLVFVVACAPALPARNQTQNMTIEPVVEGIATLQEVNATAPVLNETKPVVASSDLPRKTVVEGETVSFPNLKAVDPDGDPIKYTFSAPLNEQGIWRTTVGDAGEQVITITASDGANTVAQQVLIIVLPLNKAPMIELAEPIEATEGELFTLNPTISDADGDNVTLSFSGWMTSNTKNLSFDESGLHKVVVTASDGTSVTNKEIIVSVKNANRAPAIFELDEIQIKEGQRAIVKPAAKDPDGDTVRYEFEEPINASGIWSTQLGDAGEYEFLVIATDGELTAETTVTVIVEAVNKAPSIELEGPILANEGDVVTLSPVVSDPEGDEVRVSFGGWMDSNRRQTTYDDSGNHKVTVTARDAAGNEAELEVIVVVNDRNRPPIFGAGSFN